MKSFFETDKMYIDRFSKVFLWDDWPENDGHDTGIDIIVELSDGGYCAIQCKCYDDNANLVSEGIDSFLAKTINIDVKERILVYTGSTIANNADKKLKQSNCQIIKQEHLRNSNIDWSQHPKLKTKDLKTLREHQKEALKDVIRNIDIHDRGQLIMACGTGKTLTSLHISEKHVGIGGTILYLVPSISLILQSMREWSENKNILHSYLAVCSDKTTGEGGSISELEIPASTDHKTLALRLKKKHKDSMRVIFSTYHSLSVVIKALGKESVDLILCDEAHRTTGLEDKSFFTLVHKDSNIKGKKRIYMTATSKVYSANLKSKLGKNVYSMDDKEKYGPIFHKLSFNEAVNKGILTDFRVKIAIISADSVKEEYQRSSVDEDNALSLNEKTLLMSAWHGLTHPNDDDKPKLLQRVIAFANRIDRSMMFAGYKNDPNNVDRSFKKVVREYEKEVPTGYDVEVKHIDGKNNAMNRREKMHWLNQSTSNTDICRIVSNAKCLSEGVDVPALDGVIFLNSRKSTVDVVQSVGRVMRKSEGKDFGYVILPVAIPAGVTEHEALNDNKTFKVVWQVLNALRSHDEYFEHEINKLILDKKTKSAGRATKRISASILTNISSDDVSSFYDEIKSKLVEKVGDIEYHNKYGEKLGETTITVESRINKKIKSNPKIKSEIQKFHSQLQKMTRESISEKSTLKIIAQHLVLSKVFNALFQGKFTSHNPISFAFEDLVKKIGLNEELENLKDFNKDIENRLENITTSKARQEFIKTIYGNFFASIDKKNTKKYGIAYTPTEIVDFIILSTEHLLKEHFGKQFSDRSIKVLDPFAGTGTFITRLLESGLIDDNLYEKYKYDIHANELILLAYYIATINIETTYSSKEFKKYVPFDGMHYTDTLESNPRWREDEIHRLKDGKIDAGIFKKAHKRMHRQKGSHIHVIVGNPPYSTRQKDFDDKNKNIKYEELDKRIKDTYAKSITHLGPTAKTSLQDSYIRSIRWATDRIGNSGMISFVTNASFLRSEATAGLRVCLEKEFNEIWCFDLRGNQRTQGEVSKKEGGKIFGSDSRSPISITFLIKNPKKKGCTIHYKDIGDYLDRDTKLNIIQESKSIQGVKDWKIVKSDKYHDWLDHRNENLYMYTSIGNKKTKSGKNTNAIFKTYANGVLTARDAWVYNSSKELLSKNMKTHINYCNNQDLNNIKIDKTQGKWTSTLTKRLKKLKIKPKFNKNKIKIGLYRPFFKQYLYLDKTFIEALTIIPQFFSEINSENMVICIPDKFTGMFTPFITNIIPDYSIVTHSQCFPLYTYENNQRKENILDVTLQEYQEHYKDKTITKQDIFYYIYGLLHNEGYSKKFLRNLIRELPYIPMAPDFKIFKNIGKKLADLHLIFDTCQQYDLKEPKNEFDKVRTMKYKNKNFENGINTLQINGIDVFDNIPEVQYQVGGRTPLEWIIDRFKRQRHKENRIINDPCNDIDIIPVIERAVYVGVESDKLIAQLPKEFEPTSWTPKKTGLDAHMNTPS